MTKGYKFYIDEKDNLFYFGLYPNNSNFEEIGRSNGFETYKSAFENLTKFRTLLKKGEDIFEIKNIERKFVFMLKKNEFSLQFYRVKSYYQLRNCKKAITQIIENIDAPLLERS